MAVPESASAAARRSESKERGSIMTADKWYYKVVRGINLLCLAACIVLNLILMTHTREVSSWLRAAACLSIVAMLCALVYMLKGFRKSGAAFHKFFLYGYALSEVYAVVSAIMLPEKSASMTAATVDGAVLVLLLVLAIGKNLGRRVSFTLAGIIYGLNLLLLLGVLTAMPGVLRGGGMEGSIYGVRVGSQLVLASVTGIITFAKYADKAARSKGSASDR